MKKKNIYNLLIIDASGSMSSKVEEVRGGVNQIFEDLKEDVTKQPLVKNKITVTDFSSHGDFNVLYKSVVPEALVEMKSIFAGARWKRWCLGDYIHRWRRK